MKTLAIIPARGGSKGIARKNLVDIAGKPMVAHSIEQALAAQKVDRVIVSTEDPEIRRICLDYGAETPFVRPSELAEDDVLDLPVFEHALNWLKENDQYVPDLVLHLRPTAPVRLPSWIDDAISCLSDRPDADSLRSVSIPDKHPYRMFRKDQEGILSAIMNHEHPEPHVLRRQDLPDVYYYNCVIDVTRPSTLATYKSMTGKKILGWEIPSDMTFDVDTPRDLEIIRSIGARYL